MTRGFVADAGGVLRLPKRVPRAIAMEILLTGEPLDAATASGSASSTASSSRPG